MPKFKKPTQKKSRSRRNYSRDRYAYRTVVVSTIAGCLFLLASYFFNGTSWFLDGIFSMHLVEKETLWEVVDNTIKVSVILLTFYFFLISLGNFKELTGKPVEIKDLVLLIVLSLLQAFRNPWVFLFTCVSLPVLIIYVYLAQDR